MELSENKRKQWLLLDSESRIIGSTYPGNGIEAETDIDQWSTDDGIPSYRWDGTQAVERTEAELDADRAARPAPPPTTEEVLLELAADHEARLCEIELGV